MNTKKKKLLALAWIGIQVSAQVGIGDASPDNAAMLDIISKNKGVLIPRISLPSTTQELDGMPGQPNGLLIYNTGNALPPGFYYWNGSEWQNLESSPIIAPSITTLECDQAILKPQSFKAGVAYNGIMKIPYTGGNGAKYPAGTWITSSAGNTAMRARLKSGQLEHGAGHLTYDVVGVPKFSTPVGATFPIVFETHKCKATVGETQIVSMKLISSAGPLTPTADNNTKGYHRAITTPDGKFSIRVFMPEGSEMQNADIQIRSNQGKAIVAWNAHTSWLGGNNGTASNSLNLPLPGVWYGNIDVNSDIPDPITINKSAAWGDKNVYYGAPEQRKYIWTADNAPTVYTLTFSLGAPSPLLIASPTTINQTKAFLRIEQLQTD
jgi:hypothetical protein